GGRTGVARIAGLSGADMLVAADGGAIVVVLAAAARWTAAVVIQAGHDRRVGAAARAVGDRAARQIRGAGILVVAGSRAGAREPGGDRAVTRLAGFDGAVAADGGAVGIIGGG